MARCLSLPQADGFTVDKTLKRSFGTRSASQSALMTPKHGSLERLHTGQTRKTERLINAFARPNQTFKSLGIESDDQLKVRALFRHRFSVLTGLEKSLKEAYKTSQDGATQAAGCLEDSS